MRAHQDTNAARNIARAKLSRADEVGVSMIASGNSLRATLAAIACDQAGCSSFSQSSSLDRLLMLFLSATLSPPPASVQDGRCLDTAQAENMLTSAGQQYVEDIVAVLLAPPLYGSSRTVLSSHWILQTTTHAPAAPSAYCARNSSLGGIGLMTSISTPLGSLVMKWRWPKGSSRSVRRTGRPAARTRS